MSIPAQTIEGSAVVRGDLWVMGAATLGDDSIGDDQVKSDAAIAASKLEHQHRASFGQESATQASDEAKVVHVVKGAVGTVLKVMCGCVVAPVGAATVSVDILKNGVSILTEPLVLNTTNMNVAYASVEAVVSSAALVADDVLEVNIVETTGGGTQMKGLFVHIDLEEDYT